MLWALQNGDRPQLRRWGRGHSFQPQWAIKGKCSLPALTQSDKLGLAVTPLIYSSPISCIIRRRQGELLVDRGDCAPSAATSTDCSHHCLSCCASASLIIANCSITSYSSLLRPTSSIFFFLTNYYNGGRSRSARE